MILKEYINRYIYFFFLIQKIVWIFMIYWEWNFDIIQWKEINWIKIQIIFLIYYIYWYIYFKKNIQEEKYYSI
jgi:hypothetical protein